MVCLRHTRPCTLQGSRSSRCHPGEHRLAWPGTSPLAPGVALGPSMGTTPYRGGRGTPHRGTGGRGRGWGYSLGDTGGPPGTIRAPRDTPQHHPGEPRAGGGACELTGGRYAERPPPGPRRRATGGTPLRHGPSPPGGGRPGHPGHVPGIPGDRWATRTPRGCRGPGDRGAAFGGHRGPVGCVLRCVPCDFNPPSDPFTDIFCVTHCGMIMSPGS